MSELQQQFDACVNDIQGGNAVRQPSNEVKLEIYGLFKQATEGDVQGDRPGMMEVVKRAKYIAWENCKGLSREAAQQRYIERIEQLTKG